MFDILEQTRRAHEKGSVVDAVDQVEQRLSIDIVDELRKLTTSTAVGEVIDAATFGNGGNPR